jgi:type I restriction enzyme, S subunit
MELKPGYKQTEVGIIPDEWDVVPIGSLVFDYRGGASLRPSDFTSTGVKVLPKGGVGRTGWLNVATDEQKYCSPEYAAANYRNQVDKSYTIVVLRDLVPSGPSIGLIVQIKDDESYVLAQGVYGFKVNEKAVPGYLVHLSNTNWYRKLANSIMVGSTQVHITNTAYKKVLIPLPPLPEQKAIAEALSDADALIEALDQLIAKKRQVKQGAMQELLTGERRLLGFTEKWETRKLGDIIEFVNGKPLEKMVSNDGDYFVITLDSIDIDGNLKQEHKRSSYFDNSLQKGDIVIILSDIAHGYLLGLCDLIPEDNKYILNQRVGRLRCSYEHVPQFIRMQINRNQEFFRKRGQGTSQRHIYKRDIFDLRISLPQRDEQTAIAEILSDMDAEIAALEAKLSKAREVKAGMMSVLLGGRVRLV